MSQGIREKSLGEGALGEELGSQCLFSVLPQVGDTLKTQVKPRATVQTDCQSALSHRRPHTLSQSQDTKVQRKKGNPSVLVTDQSREHATDHRASFREGWSWQSGRSLLETAPLCLSSPPRRRPVWGHRPPSKISRPLLPIS